MQLSTAHTENNRFQITHPFHPQVGREFTIITYRQNWGEDRVYFYDDDRRLTSLPIQWTSLFAEDPLVTLANGESLFRVPDLLELVQHVKNNYYNKKELGSLDQPEEV
jgi:hypothetical protein